MRWIGTVTQGLLVAAIVSAVDAAAAVPHASTRFSTGPPPSWVEPLQPAAPSSRPPAHAQGGIYYLLFDRQVRVQGEDAASYVHYSKQILNEAGFESASQVSLDFQPSYQRLAIHSIRVQRDGRWTTRLRPSSVKLIQREAGLESQLYDGTVSAVVFVEDLRVGDVLDVSYTVTGSNPIFQGRYTGSFAAEWTVPLHRMRFRLLWPAGRHLVVRNHRTTLAPVSRTLGSQTECLWERTDPAPIAANPSVPSWFDAYGWVQLSEFETWAEVADWGRRLFELSAPLPPGLVAQVPRPPTSSPSETVLATLRFVQDQVRYVGIEMGTASHKPGDPATVLARRFGDCKDKARLFCALLREAGIDARPALVHSTAGVGLDEWHPSPAAFDHVIARVVLDGRELWVDPTLGAQGGGLEDTFLPRYRRALVLAAGTEGLSAVPMATRRQPSKAIEETYSVDRFGAPVQYRVVTRYEAEDADLMRRSIQERSREEIGRSYLEYYARLWPGISAAGPVEFVDDRSSNVLVSTERYTIPQFWDGAQHQAIHEARLWAWGVADAFETPPRTARWAPLGLPHPRHVRHVTHVELPQGWDIPEKATTVADALSRFEFRSATSGRVLTLEYDYQTLTDAVPAEHLSSYAAAVDRMRDTLTFKLRRPSRAAAIARASTLAAVAVVATLAALAGALFYRRTRRAAPLAVRAPSRQGLRGWLMAFGGFLVLVPLVEGTRLWLARVDYSTTTWMERTVPEGTEYHPLWTLLLVAVLVRATAVVVGAVLLLALLLRRRRALSVTYPAVVAVWCALLSVTLLLGQQLPGRAVSVGAAFLQAALFGAAAVAWIPYLWRSDRARSTLIR